jgi:hypothetical protein
VAQLNDGPATTYRAGESFAEFPGDLARLDHSAESVPLDLAMVSARASAQIVRHD